MKQRQVVYSPPTQVWRANHEEEKRQTFREQDVKKLKGKEMRVDDTYTRIGYGAFKNMTKVKRLVLSENIAYIGDEAFRGCTMLNTITLPQKLRRLGRGAFLGCLGLQKITIPRSVKQIDKWAFHGCDNLHRAVFEGDPEILGSGIFNRLNTTVVCKKGSRVDRYCRENGFMMENFE